MNFQAMSKQRRFILLASATGIVSLFFPWAEVDLVRIPKNINGFHGFGILVFLAFAATGVICFSGNRQKAFNKTARLIATFAGFVALLSAIISLVNVKNTLGPAAKTGFGVWISLLAAITIIASGLLLKDPHTGFRNRLHSYKRSISIPIMDASDISVNPVVNKIAELEKLSRLKENGGISEEEFQQLKSQLLLSG